MPLLPPHPPCNVRSCHSFQYYSCLMTLSSLQMRKRGMGKQTSPFFTLCTSLWSLSSPFCWASPFISAWLVTVCPTWAAVVCGMCNWLPLGTAHCSSGTYGRKYPWEATLGGRAEGLNSTKESCCLHVVEPLWALRVACPFLSAKLPVGHSKAEELLTLAILGVNSKIVKSKKKKSI